ncbi:hypothetical protein L1049_020006 [Liquidambar formosana]|uniref:Uncharacterized protein n=1 Tax=Liquidambar formosana TaxID=63359 RepID=A0AAP0SC56_LIQFO
MDKVKDRGHRSKDRRKDSVKLTDGSHSDYHFPMEKPKNTKLAFSRSPEDNGLCSMWATSPRRMEILEKCASILLNVKDIGKADIYLKVPLSGGNFDSSRIEYDFEIEKSEAHYHFGGNFLFPI